MEGLHLDFHDLDYQLHSDLEDELMGLELPAPLHSRQPSEADLASANGDGQEEDFDDLEDHDPDDPNHAGFPEEDEGSCEDLCDVAPDEDAEEGSGEDPEDSEEFEDAENSADSKTKREERT